MAKGEEIPKTTPAEVENLIEQIRATNLDPSAKEKVERLLRTILIMPEGIADERYTPGCDATFALMKYGASQKYPGMLLRHVLKIDPWRLNRSVAKKPAHTAKRKKQQTAFFKLPTDAVFF